MVHAVASAGFGGEADAYERSRPSYPPDAVAWLLDHLGVGPGSVVVDLAAGTGKFTRLLASTAADVIAVEPVQGMHRVLHEVLPGVPLIAGTAEALPVATSSVDAVSIAQAFHWFDAGLAFAELARVLRPAGAVGIVWNARDRSVDWVDRVWAIMDEVEKRAPWRDHENWRDSVFGEPPGFLPVEAATFRHEHLTTPEGVIDRIRGVSHVAVLPPAEKDAVLARVHDVLASHPETRAHRELRIPYRVDCFSFRRA